MSTPAAQTIDSLLCAALRGEPAPWPWPADAAIDAVFARARMHGVVALLHAQASVRTWPDGFVQLCRAEAQALAMWELRHQTVLRDTLSAFADEGVRPVLIKGTALAYSLYADPAHRTRSDTDLLMPEHAGEAVNRALRRIGFERLPSVPSHQVTYTLQLPDGTSHSLDIHWRINNSELLARVLPYDEVVRDAQPVPPIGPHALAPSDSCSLLIACMHRATHRHNPYHVAGESHHEPDRLIWLRDIDLIARALSEAQWQEFASAAERKGLSCTSLEGLKLAERCFRTPLSDAAFAALSTSSGRADRYLRSGPLGQHWLDFLALGSVGSRAHWLRNLALPPESYMRAKYPDGGRLPWLYLRRAAGGVAKRLRL